MVYHIRIWPGNGDAGQHVMSDLRSRVVEEARSWLGTPYRRRAASKGVGADCFTFVLSVLNACALIDEQEFDEANRTVFSDDWFCHASEERYLAWARIHASRIVETFARPGQCAGEPGDIVLVKAVRSSRYNHGAIVLEWPVAIHAVDPVVELFDVTRDPMWACQRIAVMTIC